MIVRCVIPFRTLGYAAPPSAEVGDRTLRTGAATSGAATSGGARRSLRHDLGWIAAVVVELIALVAVVLAAGGPR
jgi:hypothetical protein